MCYYVRTFLKSLKPRSTVKTSDSEKYGTAGQAIGIMMFTSNSVAKEEKKTETMKKVYAGWAKMK
jgi:hypothetical protein